MVNFKNYDTIFFDLDGTLSDSKVGIIRCLQYSLAKFNIRENNIEKLTRCIGPSLSYTYREWYGLSQEQAKQATEFYRERFEEKGIRENFLFDGVLALVRDLHAAGKKLILATAKPTVHAQRILEHQNIAGYFTEIIGSNLDGTREDKSEVIAFALTKIGGVNGRKIVMVGDRQHDILGARENNLLVIGVGYGYGTLTEITAAKPDTIVNTVEELRNILL